MKEILKYGESKIMVRVENWKNELILCRSKYISRLPVLGGDVHRKNRHLIPYYFNIRAGSLCTPEKSITEPLALKLILRLTFFTMSQQRPVGTVIYKKWYNRANNIRVVRKYVKYTLT